MEKIFKNTVFIIVTFFLIGIANNSCNDSDISATTTTQREGIETLKEDVKSFKNRLNDTLKEEHSSTSSLTEKTRNNHHSKKWSILIRWGLGLISLIFALAAFITANRSKIKIKQNRNESRNEIENLKSQLKSYLANNNSSWKRNIHTTPIDNYKLSDIEKKINHLENELSKMAMVSYSAHNITLPQSQTPPVPQQFNTKSAYFGTAISGEKGKGYFKKLLANKEDARFSAQITDKKAMFAPIVPLNAIISSDAMDLAIEFIGVSKNEAVDMSITHEGIAQQVGEKWIIIQKAIIKLKK